MIAKAARNPRLPLQIYGKYVRDKYSEKSKMKIKSLLMQISFDKQFLLVEVEVGLNITINLRGDIWTEIYERILS